LRPASTPIRRRWLVGLLLAALLLPLLGGALPRPALSAEQSLEQALRLSLCTTPGERETDGGAGGGHDGQCQLCVLGCGVCCAAPIADLAATPADFPRGSPRNLAAPASAPVPPAPVDRPLQPRAPPISLT
jgi:hypothetical protein